MPIPRVAVLDTDFLIKSYISRKDKAHCLADVVLGLPDYNFCCHGKMIDEFSVHGIGDSIQWLRNKISEGKIHCYTDGDILAELEPYYGDGAKAKYREYLKQSCDAYSSNYFNEHFSSLDVLPINTSNEIFLRTLEQCKAAIGRQQNLGEIKCMVLLQHLQFLNSGNVYQLCSDDRNARAGTVSIGNIFCISIVSLFLILKEYGYSKQELEPYWDAFEAFLSKHHQTALRVRAMDPHQTVLKVPCRQVFDEIYKDAFCCTATGDLKYKADVPS